MRRYIKTSLAFLVIGLLLGGYLVVAEFAFGVYASRLLITAHVHLLLVGFMLMLVMGVATWMFPRPARDDARYRPAVAEAAYWVMTVATGLRAAGEVVDALAGAAVVRAVIVVGSLGQLAGAVLFVLNIWARVRMPLAAPPPVR